MHTADRLRRLLMQAIRALMARAAKATEKNPKGYQLQGSKADTKRGSDFIAILPKLHSEPDSSSDDNYHRRA